MGGGVMTLTDQEKWSDSVKKDWDYCKNERNRHVAFLSRGKLSKMSDCIPRMDFIHLLRITLGK
jgi:hypothetical protein